jgi:hypothetical protein
MRSHPRIQHTGTLKIAPYLDGRSLYHSRCRLCLVCARCQWPTTVAGRCRRSGWRLSWAAWICGISGATCGAWRSEDWCTGQRGRSRGGRWRGYWLEGIKGISVCRVVIGLSSHGSRMHFSSFHSGRKMKRCRVGVPCPYKMHVDREVMRSFANHAAGGR